MTYDLCTPAGGRRGVVTCASLAFAITDSVSRGLARGGASRTRTTGGPRGRGEKKAGWGGDRAQLAVRPSDVNASGRGGVRSGQPRRGRTIICRISAERRPAVLLPSLESPPLSGKCHGPWGRDDVRSTIRAACALWPCRAAGLWLRATAGSRTTSTVGGRTEHYWIWASRGSVAGVALARER